MDRQGYMTQAIYALENDSWKGSRFMFISGNDLVVAYKGESYFGCETRIVNDFDLERLMLSDYSDLSIDIGNERLTRAYADLAMLLSLSNGVRSITAEGFMATSVQADCSFRKSNGALSVEVDTGNSRRKVNICRSGEADIKLYAAWRLHSLKDIVSTFLRRNNIAPEALSAFLDWIGDDALSIKDSSALYQYVFNSNADIAPEIIRMLVDKGFRLDLSDVVHSAFDTDEWLSYLGLFSELAEKKKLDLTRKEAYSLLSFLVEGFPGIRRENNKDSFPTLEYLEELDHKSCTLLQRIFRFIPDKVFRTDDDYILSVALSNDFFLLFESFRLVAKRFPTPYDEKDLKRIHYEMKSYSPSLPSWVIDVLKGRDCDDRRNAEAASLLYCLLKSRYFTPDADDYILELASMIGLDSRDGLGYTPFTLAYRCTFIHGCYDVVIRLIEAGSDVNAVSSYSGRTVLYNVAKENISQSVDSESLSYAMHFLEYLVLKGADPSVICNGKNVAHVLASLCKVNERMWHCFDTVSDKEFLTALDDEGKSPLAIAIENGNMEAVSFLADGGYIREEERSMLESFLQKGEFSSDSQVRTLAIRDYLIDNAYAYCLDGEKF